MTAIDEEFARKLRGVLIRWTMLRIIPQEDMAFAALAIATLTDTSFDKPKPIENAVVPES